MLCVEKHIFMRMKIIITWDSLSVIPLFGSAGLFQRYLDCYIPGECFDSPVNPRPDID